MTLLLQNNPPLLAVLEWEDILRSPEVTHWLRVTLFVVVGLILLYAVSYAAGRMFSSRQSPHFSQLMRKFIFYVGSVIILVSVLIELGFDLTGLLATAGVATLAIGFAAQTSLSNLISGLFLIGEKPFKIGDLIRTGDTTGFVESIDLLSIKIRTFENLFVRIPNESMIKNQVTNITRYPIRRMDMTIGVAYKEDVVKVMDILKELARENPFALDDPEPLILFNNFGESALEFRYGLWFERSNYLKLRNSIMKEIKERFDNEGIEIPFPHISLYTGSATKPFPVEIGGKTPTNP
ncbi:MAG: mechanosensitive ion channel family protein [Puniceicoccaceae bacterium]